MKPKEIQTEATCSVPPKMKNTELKTAKNINSKISNKIDFFFI